MCLCNHVVLGSLLKLQCKTRSESALLQKKCGQCVPLVHKDNTVDIKPDFLFDHTQQVQLSDRTLNHLLK